MSELLDFCNALVGAFDGPIEFEVGSGETVLLGNAEQIEPLAGELYILNKQADTAPFIWGSCGTDRDLNDLALRPTVVMRRDDTYLMFWAFENPAPADALAIYMDPFEPVNSAAPTPGANGWETVWIEPDTFHAFGAFEAIYGNPIDEELEALMPVIEDTVRGREEAALIDKLGAVEAARLIAPPETPFPFVPPWEDEALPDLGKYSTATIRRAYPETDPRLQQDITITVGAKRDSFHWKSKTIKVGEMMAILATHQIGSKDGLSWVLGDMADGKRNIQGVKSMSAIGLDLDTGITGATLDALLLKQPYMAVRYTTHSHLKTTTKLKKEHLTTYIKQLLGGVGKPEDLDVIRHYLINAKHYEPHIVEQLTFVKFVHEDTGIYSIWDHAPMEKHRLIFPMAAPFVIAEQGDTQKAAQTKWRLVPEALARDLGNLPLDKTGSDANRLFYLPRHDKGDPFEVSLFGGRLIDWRDLELGNKFDEMAIEFNKGRSKSVTESGRALGGWSKKNAGGFAISDLIRNECSDRIRDDKGGLIEIDCPFDDDHSNAGDPSDRGCMTVNAGEGTSEVFTISCRHEGCRDKTNLDMLGKMLTDKWFERSSIEDDDYQALLEDDGTPETAVKIEQAAEAKVAKAEYAVLCDTITGESTQDEIDFALKSLYKAEVAKIDESRCEMAMQSALKKSISTADWNKLKKAVKAEVKSDAEGDKKARKDSDGRLIFSYQGDLDFVEAYDTCVRLFKAANKTEPNFCHLDQKPVRLVRGDKDRVFYREMSARALWSELNTRVTFTRIVEDGKEGARSFVPKEVGDQVYERAFEHLVPAPTIIYTPIFNKRGVLLDRIGWHREDNILVPSLPEMEAIPQVPTAEDLAWAVNWVRDELICEFPFLDSRMDGTESHEPSFANAVAMIITPFMRKMITGCTPIFFITKPSPGTGGTLLGRIPIVLFDGAEQPAMIYTDNQEEMAKALLAAAMSARSTMFFDDVKTFNNREIMRATTSQQIGGRVLGGSTMAEVANDFNWIATGNNPYILPEMQRRICYIRMNAKMPDINTRTFKRANIDEWLYQNRSISIRAILILVQSWIANGAVGWDERKLTSFEDWGRKVGGVLDNAGIPGFLDNRKAPEADMDESAVRDFLRQWVKKFGQEPQTVVTLYDFAVGIGSEIIDGNAEDSRTKGKFRNRIAGLEDRTIDQDDRLFSVAKTQSKEHGVMFMIRYEDTNTDE